MANAILRRLCPPASKLEPSRFLAIYVRIPAHRARVVSAIAKCPFSSLLDQPPSTMNGTTPSPSPAPATKPSHSPPAPAAGTKRKRSSAGKYYAVKKGYQPGIYYEWSDCLTQVTGYKGAVCRFILPDILDQCQWLINAVQAFATFEAANAFLTGSKPPPGDQTPANSVSAKFYGIQRGRVPGVYTDWATAQEQIQGFVRPRYKRFLTKEKAEEFVREGRGDGGRKPVETPGMVGENPRDAQGVPFEAGDGPLPPGAEDKFDPNVLLDPKTGKVVYKTQEQKTATKPKPAGPPVMLRIYTDGSTLKNGRNFASAGVGVYFGPGDPRFASHTHLESDCSATDQP